MEVKFSYLGEQFLNLKSYFEAIEKVVKSGDFTLGKSLREFEESIAKLTNTKYAVGVGSGTDALFLSMKALGIKEGDEVITAPNTFYATVGAIVATHARPVFVDVDESFNIDASKIEKAITNKTRAIIPVHYMGLPANLSPILEIAKKYSLFVIEDACQALGASIQGKAVGSMGNVGVFSFHPLKNLNVWGDAGMIVTNDRELYEKLLLLRNHGLKGRDEIEFFAYNSRLDSIQAAIGNVLLSDFPNICERKKRNATIYNTEFEKLSQFIVKPLIRNGFIHAYHLYMLLVDRRDELLSYLHNNKIEAKIHYPIPLHLQKASQIYGYKRGDFPICEYQCKKYITLPVHQHLSEEAIYYVVSKVKKFYGVI